MTAPNEPSQEKASPASSEDAASAPKNNDSNHSVATFAAGCFWCTEAVFLRIKGVHKVVSGYTGGSDPKPTYQSVCSGLTGHAECVQITFDPKVVTYEQLLDVFFHTHDPTTLNRQGGDVGTQYRSAVFYHDEAQLTAARKMIFDLDQSGTFDMPIVTTLEKLGKFFPAEDYHQDYFKLNPGNPYCQVVVGPKVSKFQKRYKALLKDDE